MRPKTIENAKNGHISVRVFAKSQTRKTLGLFYSSLFSYKRFDSIQETPTNSAEVPCNSHGSGRVVLDTAKDFSGPRHQE